MNIQDAIDLRLHHIRQMCLGDLRRCRPLVKGERPNFWPQDAYDYQLRALRRMYLAQTNGQLIWNTSLAATYPNHPLVKKYKIRIKHVLPIIFRRPKPPTKGYKIV